MRKNNYLKTVAVHFNSLIKFWIIAIITMVVFILFNCQKVYAVHNLGGEITYKCTSSPGIFEITLILYAKCEGISYCANSQCSQPISIIGNDIGYVGTNFGTLNLQLTNVRDVDNNTTICPGSKSPCTNLGSVTPGT